ncbi:FOG: Transposon-encoded proteins with TYA, reverse transcriptase, integrase domains in various combinations [Plasmopara halstedii]|uniref:FOG: Transposon-encoded proteins with TYA, reverse transcriptase, integrase domains in various combinations n=1 Tax=Plasmopara halstedii TaxID=4781 RepID=A0A0P1ADH0_PLAHL|nr:FOG: Transposon-encoded proteins with TYA, reverse transcriptase, integrase domains in various combinations [Plasmopara halstedii]CEG38530.1 FOG: Transposon-encoded proteins with TYA, reverse transcriptase, integrase domains in various combinations [Plasmopara halstedii]|eukprot:XP_024574899.1 FOG: Transposon-encoded proteins with TYA, reverse transcriptase, integrase domains in various combinations [Plasmopara halstedii]
MASHSIENLGPVSKFLGIRVTALDTHAYVLDQEEAIGELLREHGMASANPTRTPIGDDCYEEVTPDSALLQENPEFGSPSVLYKATRQTHAPRVRDWKLAKRIARYLSGSKAMRLEMRTNTDRNEQITLDSYSDADFAADKGDR